MNETYENKTGTEEITQNTGDITGTIMLIIIIGAIITGSIIINKSKRRKEEIKEWKETKEEIRKLIKEIEEKEGIIKTRGIKINKLPEDVKEEILEKGSALYNIFVKDNKDGQPFLLLIRNNGNIEIKKNVKEGQITIKTKKDGEEIRKTITLSANKLHIIKTGELIKRRILVWVAYEDEAEAYPIKEGHLAETLFNMIQYIKLSEGMIQNKKGKIPKWLIILVVLGIIGVIVYFTFFSGTNTGATNQIIENVTKATIEVAKENTSNVIKIG